MTALLVASIGGHLTQLHQLRPRLTDGPVRWVTNDSPQSRSLLAGEDVEWVPYVAPRDWLTAMRMIPRARRLVKRDDVDLVISTGSAIAVPFLTVAALGGRRTFYIESATRADGPSLTGKLLARVPRVQLRTQSPIWAGKRWKFVGSVFEGWTTAPTQCDAVRSVVVSLGTMKGHQFRALVDRIHAIMPPGTHVLWQVGATDVADLPIAARAGVPADELRDAMERADVVIAHAGTGIALSAMEAGKCPVLVPRRASRGEHVDDHQLQTARRLASSGLAITAEVDELTWDDVLRAARTQVLPRADQPKIDLDA